LEFRPSDKNILLDFGTNPDLDLDDCSINDRGHLGIKYELKELWMYVFDIFGVVGLRITNGVGGGLNSMSAF